ncbi:hypothetical protein L9F63_018619 [Diploptera punctata]|uniref:Uncharacterized protein n=1 Tax=Diploptera punctata TaxID=6984 RepID=A0AAD7ZW03_DIPPU|nr:hypothetical protein L9F63_018619 [Diploptera punctata]
MQDGSILGRNPGSRMGSSLWFDNTANSWWLFGGRQIPVRNNTKLKIYTDLWRYDTINRNWNRIFPNDRLKSLVGGMITLRTSLFNDGHIRKSSNYSRNPGVVLCGRSEGKNLDERSLAVYGPRSSRSDTVWQLELKDKQWTAYVCCCDNTERSAIQSVKNTSSMPTGTVRHESNAERNYTIVHGKIKDENCNDTIKMIHKMKEDINKSNSDNIKNNTKKLTNENHSIIKDFIKSDGIKSNAWNKKTHFNTDNTVTESSATTTQIIITTKEDHSHSIDNDTIQGLNSSNNKTPKDESSDVNQTTFDNDKHCLPELENENIDVLERNATNISSEDSQSLHSHKIEERDANDDVSMQYEKKQKSELDGKTNDSNQAFCPDFETYSGSNERSKGQPVAWCDTTKEFLVALDLKVLPLTLWQFDLKTSHWTQQKVDIEDGILWPGCSSGIRYASTSSSVYILCLPYGSTKPTSTRLVYKLDANNCSLQASGQLQLNNMFDTPEGNAMWNDETKTILQTIDADYNKTLLLIAYDKLLDIWVLDRSRDRPYFVQVDNIWRGSALKWFRAYDAPFYNLQMAGQSWLLPNPRQVTDYWPHERGRFIIRLIDQSSSPLKEELHTLDIKNNTDSSLPILQHHQTQDGIKALVFFALSLSIFAIFGMAVFVRRCVTCPPQSWPLRNDDGNKTTPPVIRYSVIPDDLAYPVA